MQPSSTTPHPLAASDSEQASGFDPWILWVTVRRCWYWAAPVGLLLGVLAGYSVISQFVPRYRASHLLEANKDFVAFKGVMPTIDNLARNEKPLFYNPIVLAPVLSDPELRSAPSLSDPETAEANLRENLSVSSAGSKSQLVVSYTETDREMAAKICNAIVQAYLRQRDAFDNSRVSTLERWLEPEIERWQAEVASRQKRVHSLSERTLGYNPSARVSVADDKSSFDLFTQLRSEITEIEVQLSIWDARKAMRHNEQASNPDPDTPSKFDDIENMTAEKLGVTLQPIRTSEVNEGLSKLRSVNQASQMVSRYEKKLLEMDDNDLRRINQEYYAEMTAKRDQWQEALETAREKGRITVVKNLEEKAKQQFEADIAKAKWERTQGRLQAIAQSKNKKDANARATANERRDLESRLAVLRKEYDEERLRLEQLGGASADLQFANEELSVANEVLKKLRDRVAAIRTERRQDGAVRSLAIATPPSTPIEKIPLKKMMMTSGAVFSIPFLFGLLWELRTQRITDANAVDKSKLLAPVVGELARAPLGNGRNRRVFEESVDTLRANLSLSKNTRDARTFSICSSMSGEGKSTSAAQLALSMAKASSKTVLLIDGDTRCPDLHDVFGIELGPGLTNVLTGDASLNEAINRSLGDVLHILPAGRLSESPHRLITREAIDSLLEEALAEYDYVVFDTAPVLSAGETLALASATDATLICVMRDKTRMDSVQRTTRRLEASGAHVAGTIFSGVSARHYAYRYGDYQYSDLELTHTDSV